MQVSYQFKAVSSPCHTCKNLGKDGYTDCADWCEALAAYLEYLGEPPNVPPQRNLHLVFPVKKTGCRVELCTLEECQKAVKIIQRAKKKNKALNLSAEIGISVEMVNSLNRGHNKRIAKKSYEKIVKWNQKN